MPPANLAAEMLTVEDYRATPEGTRYQLVEGELIMSPAPNTDHQRIVRNLSQLLCNHVTRHLIGEVFFAPFDVYLSDHDVVQPDLLFISQSNIAIIAADGIHGPPDLVIEVLSWSTAQLDKKRKRLVYARAGVKELWLVDPLLSQIQRYDFVRDTAKPVQLIEENETFATPLLPGLELSAAEIFKR
jgi:Uma2 family endonuclease